MTIEEAQQIIKEKDEYYQARIDSLESQLNAVIKLLNGFKSERFVADIPASLQGNLFGDSHSEPELVEQKIEAHTRTKKKHPGRECFPEHLPVEEIILEPEIDLENGNYKRIGEQITETLHFVKPELKIIRRIRPKYIEKLSNNIIIADLPSRPVPKCIAETSLISQIMIAKFVDHLPFYRQRKIFKRDFNWDVSDSTINDWFKAHVEVLRPIYNLLLKKILAEGYIQADESPIQVQDENKKKTTHKGYMWVYNAPRLAYVYFDYRKGRGMHGPREILNGYTGYLQCDGYKVYDKLGKVEGITLVGCLAHLRRKFVDAQDYDEVRASHALSLIQSIYLLDRQTELADKREQQKHIWNTLCSWAEQEGKTALPKSPLGKALSYLLGQRNKLSAIFTDDIVSLDNNLVENKIRPLALGRKNFLFAGSHEGAQRIAIIETIMGTCKSLNIDPRKYLETLLNRISDHPINKLNELLPDCIHL